MVHALDEIRRTLAPEGVMIDLRPLADGWPVELVSKKTRQVMGRLTDLPNALADDEAANNAIQEAARQGWFQPESEKNFPFFYYWDTPQEMLEYIQEEWGDFIQIDQTVYSAIQKAWSHLDAKRRVRVQVKMHLGRWIKR